MSDENNPSTEPSFDSAKAHVREAADQLRSAAGAKARELRQKAEAKAGAFRESAEEKVHEYREKAEQKFGAAREKTRTLQEEGEAYVRQHPAKAVLTALAAGFVLGLVMRK